MHDDFDRCYRAVMSKDARFDGWFVTAVLTTKIYCRPSCPVRPPYAKNIRFLPTAAAAANSRGSGRASGVGPTRRRARPSGTSEPTSCHAQCVSSATVWLIARG